MNQHPERQVPRIVEDDVEAHTQVDRQVPRQPAAPDAGRRRAFDGDGGLEEDVEAHRTVRKVQPGPPDDGDL